MLGMHACVCVGTVGTPEEKMGWDIEFQNPPPPSPPRCFCASRYVDWRNLGLWVGGTVKKKKTEISVRPYYCSRWGHAVWGDPPSMARRRRRDRCSSFSINHAVTVTYRRLQYYGSRASIQVLTASGLISTDYKTPPYGARFSQVSSRLVGY